VDGELYLSDPKAIKDSQFHAESLNATLEAKNDSRYFWQLDLMNGGMQEDYEWIDSQDTSPKHMLSPLMFQLSSHFFLQDFCKDHHPDFSAEKCAFAYGYFRKYQEYDMIEKGRHIRAKTNHLGKDNNKAETTE
jgi:hypothetical protein